MMKILIMFPLQKELDGFVQGCQRLGIHPQEATIGRLDVIHLPQLEMTLAHGGIGKSQFALQTQHLLDQVTDWALVICTGAAGSMSEQVAIGDIVVGTTTVEHDYNNKFKVRPKPRFGGDPATVASFRETPLSGQPFALHFDIIASGDEDVVSRERQQTIRALTEGVAVAWEGAGGARACQFSRVPFVEVRGITDAADQEAAATFEMNLAEVMGHVAQFIVAWASQDGTA